jgi:hypothetical protein
MHLKTTFWTLILICLAVSACQAGGKSSASESQPAVIGQPFQVRGGQTITLANANLSVRFTAVVQDSRCPKAVQCVWSGRAVIRLNLQSGSQPAADLDMALNLGQAGPEMTYQGYRVTLQILDPYPEQAGQTIALGDYIATLVITK